MSEPVAVSPKCGGSRSCRSTAGPVPWSPVPGWNDGTVTELPAAVRAARQLVQLVPLRESGHQLLMRALADQGPAALYGGEIGERLVADLQANGGLLAMDDLTSYAIREHRPGSCPSCDVGAQTTR